MAFTNHMRRVLCIAYHFPPSNSFAGALRSAEFARHMPAFGWEVTVLSLRENLGEEEFGDVVRIPSLWPWKRPFNLSPYGWLLPLLFAAWHTLRQRKYDAIYVSCPPFGFVPAVAWLKKISGLPLVVDFRDAWTPGPYRDASRLERAINRYVFRSLEQKLLRLAGTFVVNTPSAARAYLSQYPWLGGRLHYLPNGYNEEMFSHLPDPAPRPEFTLLHCGPFNISGRDPEPVLAALRMLRDEGKVVHLRVLGETGDALERQALSWGVDRQVDILPPKPHGEALRLQQDCDVLLLYQAECKARVTAVAGKTYEYIRSAKPILVVAPQGDNRRLVEHYAGYAVVAEGHRPESIADGIRRLLQAWQRGELPKLSPPSGRFLQYFERRSLSGRLARILDSVVQTASIPDKPRDQ